VRGSQVVEEGKRRWSEVADAKTTGQRRRVQQHAGPPPLQIA
jgi:hypothetical protein